MILNYSYNLITLIIKNKILYINNIYAQNILF